MAIDCAATPSCETRQPLRPGKLLILACVVALAAFPIYQSRLHHQRQARAAAENQAVLLEGRIGGLIGKTDLALRSVALEADSLRPAPAGQAGRLLARQQTLHPWLAGLGMTDERGSMLYRVGTPPLPDRGFAGEAFFRQLQGAGGAELAFSGPYPGPAGGNLIFARRMSRPDGSFAGVAYAIVGSAAFEELLASAPPAPDSFASLHTADLKPIARIPRPEAPAGVEGALPPEYAATVLAAPESGVFLGRDPADRTARLIAYRRLADIPAYVAVGLPSEAYLAPWRQDIFLSAGVLLAGGLALAWLHRSGRRARRQHEDTRRLLQEAVGSVAIGFSVFDAEDRLVICNEAIRDFFPENRDILVPGAHFEDLVRTSVVRGKFADATDNPYEWVRERLRRHRAADGVPFELRLADGRRLLVIEHRTASGHIVCNRIDITELVRYRDELERLVETRTAELRAALARFRTLVRQSPTAIAMTDRNLVYLAASDRWVECYCLAREDLAGRRLYDAHPDLPEHWKAAFSTALAGTPAANDGELWVRTGGRQVWLRWTVHPWRDESGDVGGLIISTDDITARRQAEEASHRHGEHLRLALEAARMGTFEYDPATDRVHREGLLHLALGLASDASSADYSERLHPEDNARFLAIVANLNAHNPAYNFEYRLRIGDGSYRWLADSARGEFDGEGKLTRILGVCTDIGERKETEMEIKRLNADLERRVQERTAQLEASNQELQGFTYAASHDMKAPLGRIVSFSTLLERNYRHSLDGDGLLFLDFIRRNAQRLNALIEDLLAHAQVELHALDLQPLEVRGAVEAVLAEKEEEIRTTRAEIRLCLPAPGFRVVANRHSLIQVLRNLLENALKYSARQGVPVIEIGGQCQGDACRLWVRDSGIGFDMIYHDRIFEIFRRLHTYEEYPGSGVGLALVKKAMERMQGRVWAESTPGQGATFFLELPAAAPEPAAAELEPA